MRENADGLKAQLEQKREQLQVCNKRLHAIMTKNRDGILVVDRKRTILHANPAAATIFGCTEKELEGEEYVFPLELDGTTELEVRARDGKAVMVETWAVETEWDGNAAYFVSLHDITEQAGGRGIA